MSGKLYSTISVEYPEALPVRNILREIPVVTSDVRKIHFGLLMAAS